MLADANRLDRDVIEVGVMNLRQPGNLQAAATMLRKIGGPLGFKDVLRDEVLQLAVPTHFVWGDADPSSRPMEAVGWPMPPSRRSPTPVTCHGWSTPTHAPGRLPRWFLRESSGATRRCGGADPADLALVILGVIHRRLGR